MLRNVYGGVAFSLKEDGKNPTAYWWSYSFFKIKQLMDIREVTDETFLSDIAKITNNNKKA